MSYTIVAITNQQNLPLGALDPRGWFTTTADFTWDFLSGSQGSSALAISRSRQVELNSTLPAKPIARQDHSSKTPAITNC